MPRMPTQSYGKGIAMPSPNRIHRKMKGLPCVYCGQPSTTKDHIPPKQMFAPSTDLITVPCCEECRDKQSRDDEYFRLVMVARLDVDDHPVIEAITDPALRSLDKPKAQKFRKMFLGSVAERDLFSRSGIYLGSAPTFTANVSRQNKVMKR